MNAAPNAAEATGPRDPMIRDNQTARYVLGTFTVFLHLWQTHDFGASLNRFLELEGIPPT
jgi:hypothetical protein